MTAVQSPILTPEIEHGNTNSFLQLAMTALRLSSQKNKQQQTADFYQSTKIINELQVISLDEVSYHDHKSDCWIIIYDRVYDITNFLRMVSIILLIVIKLD